MAVAFLLGASAISFVLAACGAEASPPSAPEGQSLSDPLPLAPPALSAAPEPAAHPPDVQIGTERFEGNERPACPDGRQAVVVDRHPWPDGTSVWACASSCDLGSEYVSVFRFRRRGRALGMKVECVPACKPGTHRQNGRQHDVACEDGPEDPDVHRALVRERAGQLRGFHAHEATEIATIDQLLEAVEHAHPRAKGPLSLSEEDYAIWMSAAEKLQALQTARQRARVPLEPNPSLDKLATRLERFRGHAEEYFFQNHMYTDGSGRGNARTMAEVDQFCRDECVRLRDVCLAECRGGSEEECAACQTGEQQCFASVQKWIKRRAATHAYATEYPSGCGP